MQPMHLAVVLFCAARPAFGGGPRLCVDSGSRRNAAAGSDSLGSEQVQHTRRGAVQDAPLSIVATTRVERVLTAYSSDGRAQ